jgi:hypothetical protein
VVKYLSGDAQPLFFPMGETIVDQVLTQTGPFYQAIFLPEVCDLPVGIAWPTSISYEDFYSSVRGLKGGYSHFLTVLTTLQPQLTAWLGAVRKTLTSFTNASLPFLDLHPSTYLSLVTNDFPR